MRTTKLLATILVAGLIVSACQQDPDYVLPAIRVANTELYFSADTEQSLEFTATRDWRVRSKPDWVTVSPDQGSGSESLQRVRIAVDANPNYNRTGEVILSIGLAKSTVAIIQPGSKGEVPVGSGTLEDPYTITGVLRYIATLGADVESPQTVYVKGKISSVDDPYGAQFGSGTFKIKDADGDVSFQIYRAYFLGNKKWTASDPQIQVGDEVVVCGTVVNFKGNTPETAQNKAYIYSLNGKTASNGGGGGGQSSEVKTVTVAEFNAAEPSTTQKYQLTGKVTGNVNSTYGNFDLEDATGTVYVYGLTKTDLGYGSKNDQSFASLGIKAGDTVTLIGYRATFTKDGQSKIEVVNAYYVSHTSGGGGNEGGGGSASGNGTLSSPYNAAAAAAAVANLTWTSNTEYQKTEEVYVKGKICQIANNGTYGQSGDFGNASYYISDDGSTNGTQFYVFRSLYFGGEKYTAGTDIKVGDEVIIKGKLMNYKGNTPETVANESCLYSLNGKTE